MIFYDYHEDQSPVPELIKRLGVSLTRTKLQVGDYVVSGDENVVVERKEAGDYVSSLKDGSLHTQLYELSTNYPYAILLVEGVVTRELMVRKIKRQQLLSSLAGAILKRSPDGKRGVISLVNVDTPWDSSLFLKYCHDKVTKEDGLVRTPVLKAQKWKPEERTVGILAGFPGVGEVRAQNIMSRPQLNTLQKVMNAEVEDLVEADNVGPVVARDIYRLARKEYGEKQ
jgi:ERCC4-type nuclease